MEFALFAGILLFITIMLSFTPYLLKKHVVFGVTVPEKYTNDKQIQRDKKLFSLIVLFIGTAAVIALSAARFWFDTAESRVIVIGLASQFGMMFLYMMLYILFHIRMTKRKRSEQWEIEVKSVRIADLSARSKDEMLPGSLLGLPAAVTAGLVIYTYMQYGQLPDLIPTHWGPDGQADAFTEKNRYSVIALPLILLIMQLMMLLINWSIKRSGIKVNPARPKASQIQQLTFRKYTSWILLLISLSVTVLFAFLQLTTIHEGIAGPILMLMIPLGFTVILLIAVAVYAFKIGQGGSRVEVAIEEEPAEDRSDISDDKYWKAGVFYVNKEDPSIFVEKRFGVGYSINYGNPVGYLILFLPVVLILLIAFFL